MSSIRLGIYRGSWVRRVRIRFLQKVTILSLCEVLKNRPLLFSPIFSRKFDDLARLYYSGGYLSRVSLLHVFYRIVRCNDDREPLLVPVVDKYKELLADPVWPLLLVYVVDDEEGTLSHSLEEVFSGSLLRIEALLYECESSGPVHKKTIHPVSGDEFVCCYDRGRRLSCSNISPEVEAMSIWCWPGVQIRLDNIEKPRVLIQMDQGKISKFRRYHGLLLGFEIILRKDVRDLSFCFWTREPLFIHHFPEFTAFAVFSWEYAYSSVVYIARIVCISFVSAMPTLYCRSIGWFDVVVLLLVHC